MATYQGPFGIYSEPLWHLVYEWAFQGLNDYDKSNYDK